MKQAYLVLSFLFVVITFCNAQDSVTEVTYKRNIDLNELPEKFNESQKKSIGYRYKNYDLMSYTLLFNRNESLFFLADSIKGMFHDVEDNSLKRIIRDENRKRYYKNIKENKVLYKTFSGGESLLTKRELKDIEWKLLSETKKIGNYNCIKARLIVGNILLNYDEDMIIEAWFTPEIAVPFGPLNFEGLPGLILELKLGRNVFYASNVNFKSKKIIKPLVEDDKTITQQAYSDYLREFIEGILKNK